MSMCNEWSLLNPPFVQLYYIQLLAYVLYDPGSIQELAFMFLATVFQLFIDTVRAKSVHPLK